MSDAVRRPLPPSLFARLAQATRYAITGVVAGHLVRAAAAARAEAPPEVKGRQWDYPFGVNLNYIPRATAASRSRNCARSPTPCRCCAR